MALEPLVWMKMVFFPASGGGGQPFDQALVEHYQTTLLSTY
jgi:hypothetical protein